MLDSDVFAAGVYRQEGFSQRAAAATDLDDSGRILWDQIEQIRIVNIVYRGVLQCLAREQINRCDRRSAGARSAFSRPIESVSVARQILRHQLPFLVCGGLDGAQFRRRGRRLLR